MFQSMLTDLKFSLEFVSPFSKTGVIFSCLRIDGNSDWYWIIKAGWKNYVKIWTFSLIILEGISEPWQGFYASKFKISCKILSLSTHLKENWGFSLHTFPMVSMMEDFCILRSLSKHVPHWITIIVIY